jgi:hypothetical protein
MGTQFIPVTDYSAWGDWRARYTVKWGPDTFRGGYVKGAQDVVLSDSNHINIVTDAIRYHRQLIDSVLSPDTAKERL